MSSTSSPKPDRGALSNPEGRFESRRIETIDDGWPKDPEAQELPPLETTVSAEHAKKIITRNDSPDIPFEQSINPYRGCEHGCVYCISGDTRVLMGNGGYKALCDIRVGDEVYGTEKRGSYRYYVRTRVRDHWQTRKPAYRLGLADGSELVASGDHRFLTERGWKFVDRDRSGQRPHLTLNNTLMGFGSVPPPPRRCDTREYRCGYLCGVIRGDGHLGVYRYRRAGRAHGDQYRFRLAMIDNEALERTARYLGEFGVGTSRFVFQPERPNRQRSEAIRTSARASIEAIGQLIRWPERYQDDWVHGFIAGIFDAEGSFTDGILRIANSDGKVIEATRSSLTLLGFDTIVETARAQASKPVHYVRVRGGLREHLRLFRSCDPAIARKRDITGQAVKSRANLSVISVERVGVERDLFDITTGTGDFIANGVISHNCFARPTHSYVNLSPGLDFETKLFYKARAAELLETELSRPGYVCKPINLGASTDPYQPIERKLKVTRSILEVLQRHHHPVTIVTKSALIVRDLDILTDMARRELVAAFVSVTTLDPALKRGLEPRAPAPAARLHAVQALRKAGVPIGIFVAPVIPAVNDHEIERILEAAAQAGAQTAGYALVRLPYEVKTLFREWLDAHMPDRAEHVMSLIRAMRNGRDNDPRFGSRMRGEGPYAELIGRRFETACRRFGLARQGSRLSTQHFRQFPSASEQLTLL